LNFLKNKNNKKGWDPEPSSFALSVIKKVHGEEYDNKTKVYAVHAGLECGLIKKQYPDMVFF